VNVSTQAPLKPTATRPTAEGVAQVGTAEKIVVRTIGKDGQTTSIFTAREYVPRETRGDADVIEPGYEFFLNNGRRLKLEGDRGTVNIEEHKGRNAGGSPLGQEAAAPTRGQLYGVTIRIFEAGQTGPSLTLKTNNASFDNQTFRIATEKYTDANGKDVPADQVPVTIRGNDVDFDGRGLTVRYDDLNQQIALLQIAHGERVVIKNPAMIARMRGDQAAKEKKPAPTPAAPATEQSVPVAEKPPAPPTGSVETTPPINSAQQPTAYRASFRDKVRITQGDSPMAEADLITIDFRLTANDKKPPSTQPATRPAAATAATTAPASQPAELASTAPAPATKPADQPIVIRWVGPLLMTALKDKDLTTPLAPGDSIVTATGSPLVLHQPQGTVVCASMKFRSADNSVSFYTGESASRVTFADAANDTRLSSTQVDYNDTTKTAVLLGASNLHMKLARPTTGPATQPAQELVASWSDRCEAKLAADGSGQPREIDLAGSVDINHPQMKLKSDALSLAFEPDSKDKTKASLHQATATGNVDANLSDADHPDRRVRSQKLVVTMAAGPDGTVYAHQVDAAGSVVATDTEQSMTAERVQLVMKPKPATQPAAKAATSQPGADLASVDLESFLAEGGVVLKGKDSSGKGDRISVAMENEHPVVQLTGQPAELTQQGRTITGPSIYARPDDGYALVDGAGTIHQDGGPATRPADMSWAGKAEMDAGKNLITFTKDIKVKTRDTDGTIINATGDECWVTLHTLATTRPTSSAPAKPQAAVTGDAIKNKAIASIMLTGHVVVDSNLTTDGRLIKRTNLKTDRVIANLDDQQQLTSIDIPGPGQALYEDHREQKPDDKHQQAGAVAIEWKKNFHFDQKPEPVATFSGNVKMAQLPKADSPESDLSTLEASRVRVTLDQPPATRPTTRQASATTKGAAPKLAAGVKRVDATAPVVFKHDKTTIYAQSLQFIPAEHMIVLIGNDRTPVTWEDGNTSKGTFSELWFDTEQMAPVKWTGISVQSRQ
jgi:lipopolysaccharide export system protein LptA